jgi:peptidoglycan/LPS O-acetylase OafA/YrhL
MTNKYLIQLDGLRTFAVAMVIFCHYAAFSAIHSLNVFLGSAGVNLFFVLSGFLITSILISNKESQKTEGYSNWFAVKQFYVRRFLRIFPLYYLVIIVGFLIDTPGCRANIVALATYTTNWTQPHQGDLLSYAHMWSLCVEEQYYIIFPIIFIFLNSKHIKKLIVGMIVIAVISRIFITVYFFSAGNLIELGRAAYKITPACLDAFGAGALFAFVKFYYPHKALKMLNNKNSWILPCLFAFASLLLWMVDGTSDFMTITNALFNRTLISISSVYVIGLAAFSQFSGHTGRFLENKAIVYLGKISYGIYVYHYVLMYLFEDFSPTDLTKLDLMLSRVACLLLTIGLASVSWAIFEKPFNDLKRYFPYTNKKPVLVPVVA